MDAIILECDNYIFLALMKIRAYNRKLCNCYSKNTFLSIKIRVSTNYIFYIVYRMHV